MVGLKEQLDKIRDGAKTRIPPDKRAIMHRATEDLRASGIMDGVVRVGDAVPRFALRNTRADLVESERLLANGPLVLSFFRGKW